MATLYYNNATLSYDVSNLGNWWQDAGYSVPALALPTTSDDVFLTGESDFAQEGVLNCHDAEFALNASGNIVVNHTGTLSVTGSNISGGTFNGPGTVSVSGGMIMGGDFNTEVEMLTGFGMIVGGIFAENVTVTSGSLMAGTFNATVDISDAASLMGGIFNGLLILGDYLSMSNVEINGSLRYENLNNTINLPYLFAEGGFLKAPSRVSFDSGATWWYRATSDGVADTGDVRAGVTNLDQTGTLGGGTLSITVE